MGMLSWSDRKLYIQASQSQLLSFVRAYLSSENVFFHLCGDISDSNGICITFYDIDRIDIYIVLIMNLNNQ